MLALFGEVAVSASLDDLGMARDQMPVRLPDLRQAPLSFPPAIIERQ